MLDLAVTLGGVGYGAALVAVAFIRNRLTEALRIDALIVPAPTEATRLINALVGLLLLGYNAHTLLR